MTATNSSVFVTVVALLLILSWTAVEATTTLPFSANASSASNVPLWFIRQSGAGSSGFFSIVNPANTQPALLGITAGRGIGIFGRTQAGPYAIFGQNLTSGIGVYGKSDNGFGVRGNSITNAGVLGQNTNTIRLGGDRAGVFGHGNAEDGGRFISLQSNGLFASGGNFGVHAVGRNSGGFFESSTGDGVIGRATAQNQAGLFAVHTGAEFGYGVFAITDTGVGVRGVNQSVSAGANAVVGEISSSTPGGFSVGVRGINNGTGGAGIGVYGSQNGSGWGVWGHVVGAGIGVRGSVDNIANGFAGFFAGNVQVVGNLTKSSGAFKIDHPLDPQNKYLYHSFVESPDMKNIYDGTVILDENGEAVVQLPDYFEALNKNFRYQLTSIGAPGPNLYVAEEIANNSFKIGGGQPGGKVSWQVTGIRKDAYALANPIPVEQDKPAKEKGSYLNPEAFGQPTPAPTQ